MTHEQHLKLNELDSAEKVYLNWYYDAAGKNFITEMDRCQRAINRIKREREEILSGNTQSTPPKVHDNNAKKQSDAEAIGQQEAQRLRDQYSALTSNMTHEQHLKLNELDSAEKEYINMYYDAAGKKLITLMHYYQSQIDRIKREKKELLSGNTQPTPPKVHDDIKAQKLRDQYSALTAKMKTATTEDDFRDLAREFRAKDMVGYLNSAQLADECDRIAVDAADRVREIIYNDSVKSSVARKNMANALGSLSKTISPFQKTIGADSSYSGMSKKEFEEKSGYGQNLAKRTTNLMLFFFGDEIYDNDETQAKISPGIDGLHEQKHNVLTQLYKELRIASDYETELNKIINENPAKVEDSMAFCDGLYEFYSNWVTRNRASD